LHEVASQIHHGDIERTSRRILDDFRKGILGPIPLELPPN
ncbi:MAG: ribosome biogenesis GTPase YlqF, partial [Trichodesmium sp. St17_bin3_1_1]|nr:ribosome biogenesis GTPase YlqF [Trichodesmium sp. St17_bin3_1_1]